MDRPKILHVSKKDGKRLTSRMPKNSKSWGWGIIIAILVIIFPARLALQQRNMYMQERSQLLSQDRVVKQSIREGVLVQTHKAAYAQKVRFIYTKAPQTLNLPSVINDLSKLAIKDGIVLSQLTPPTGLLRSNGAQGLALNQTVVVITGTFPRITQFIHDIQGQSRIYQVVQIQISSNNAGSAGNQVNPNITGNDSATLTINAISQ